MCFINHVCTYEESYGFGFNIFFYRAYVFTHKLDFILQLNRPVWHNYVSHTFLKQKSWNINVVLVVNWRCEGSRFYAFSDQLLQENSNHINHQILLSKYCVPIGPLSAERVNDSCIRLNVVRIKCLVILMFDRQISTVLNLNWFKIVLVLSPYKDT